MIDKAKEKAGQFGSQIDAADLRDLDQQVRSRDLRVARGAPRITQSFESRIHANNVAQNDLNSSRNVSTCLL